MKHKFALSVALLLVAFYAATANAVFTDADWQKMKTGEILIKEVTSLTPDGGQKINFEAKLFMKAPREQVWKVLHDYNRFGEFFPNVVETKIIEQKGEAYWVQYHTKVMWVDAKYALKFDGVEKNKKILVTLDTTKPHSIRDTNSTWLLEDAPGGAGTIVTYTTYVDPGIPAPAALARKTAKSSLPKVVGNVRMRVESGGTWKKEPGS